MNWLMKVDELLNNCIHAFDNHDHDESSNNNNKRRRSEERRVEQWRSWLENLSIGLFVLSMESDEWQVICSNPKDQDNWKDNELEHDDHVPVVFHHLKTELTIEKEIPETSTNKNTSKNQEI